MLLCYGQPGSGKSSLIYHQLLQDVRNKNPFILFDTHQDLFRQALAALISHNWQPSEVILIDVHDYRRLGVPGLHLLELREQQEPAQVVATVLYAFRELWRDSWGYRMEDILRQSLRCLLSAGLSIGELELFLTDEELRYSLLQEIKDPELKAYWESHIGGLKKTEMHYILESSRNKASSFLSHPFLKAFFSQKSTFSFADALKDKAVLISLSKTRLGEASGLFGALIWCRLYLDILTRERQEERIPATIYADECAGYICQPVLDIAGESRKFGISLRLFAQSPLQLKEYASLLFGTCGTIVSFAVDREAAEVLAKQIWSFSPNKFAKHESRDFWGPKEVQFYSVSEQIQNAISELELQRIAQCYIRTRGEGDDGNPWIATVPKVEHFAISPEREEEFRQESARIYCRSLEGIDQDRRQRLERFLSEAPKKSRNRS